MFVGIGPKSDDDAAAFAFAARVCHVLHSAAFGDAHVRDPADSHQVTKRPLKSLMVQDLKSAWSTLERLGEKAGYRCWADYEGLFSKIAKG